MSKSIVAEIALFFLAFILSDSFHFLLNLFFYLIYFIFSLPFLLSDLFHFLPNLFFLLIYA